MNQSSESEESESYDCTAEYKPGTVFQQMLDSIAGGQEFSCNNFAAAKHQSESSSSEKEEQLEEVIESQDYSIYQEKAEKSEGMPVSLMQSMLSFKLTGLKYGNNHVVALGETIVQEFSFVNDGQLEWPKDTYFILCAPSNPLDLPEEIHIGALPRHEQIII